MTNLKHSFHSLQMKRRSYFDKLLAEYEMNLLEAEILVLLKQCPSNNTFRKIQETKEYAKSHISAAIANLIADGYVAKHYEEGNKKVFYLTLLDKSEAVIEKFEQCAVDFNTKAFENICEQDKETFIKVITKMIENLNLEQGVKK